MRTPYFILKRSLLKLQGVNFRSKLWRGCVRTAVCKSKERSVRRI